MADESQLAVINEKLDNLIRLRKEDREWIESMIYKHDHSLYGNGTQGLTTTTSNHGQILKALVWVVGVVVLAVVPMLMRFIFGGALAGR